MKTRTVDDFTDAGSWLPVASGEAQIELTSESGAHGRALRMDFDFSGIL